MFYHQLFWIKTKLFRFLWILFGFFTAGMFSFISCTSGIESIWNVPYCFYQYNGTLSLSLSCLYPLSQPANAFVQHAWTLCEDEAAVPEVLHAEGHWGGVPLHEGPGPLQHQWVCGDSVWKKCQQVKYDYNTVQPYFRELMGGVTSGRVIVVFWLCGHSASAGPEEPALFWWTANLFHQGAGPFGQPLWGDHPYTEAPPADAAAGLPPVGNKCSLVSHMKPWNYSINVCANVVLDSVPELLYVSMNWNQLNVS